MSMVHANGVDLHVEEVAPAGPRTGTAVLIHGMTSDSMASWFLTLAHPLAQAGFRVLLYDLRGHGHSERPPAGYALIDFVDDLDALLTEHWQVDGRVHLFGNSFGGTVAFSYAARHPEKAAGIVTVESAPPTEAWFRRMARRLARAAETLADAESVVNSRPLMARKVRDTTALLAQTTVGEELPASTLPAPDRIAAIDCPVLCLYGSESAVQELIPATERLLPQSRHIVVEGQKHTLLIKAPDQVQAAVLPWLSASAVH
jgi:pimeloyl-ACP methyl ester carboxylesterase